MLNNDTVRPFNVHLLTTEDISIYLKIETMKFETIVMKTLVSS